MVPSRTSTLPRAVASPLALVTALALLAAPAAARAGTGGPPAGAPFLDLSLGAGGAGGLGPGGMASLRYTYWVAPWLGLGAEVATEGGGSGDSTDPGDAVSRTGAALAVALRSSGPHADAVLTLTGGLAHTQATHYAPAPTSGSSSAAPDCYTDPGAGLCAILGFVSALGNLASTPPPMVATHADYLAPSISLSGQLVFHTWKHVGITLGLRGDAMALGAHPIPADGEGVNLLGTLGLALR